MRLNENSIQSKSSKITNFQSNLQIFKDFTSNLVSSLSGQMFTFGMGIMLLKNTHSPLSFGIEIIISPIISILFLIPIGNIVDRYRHKAVLITSMILRLLSLIIFSISIDNFTGNQKLIPVIVFVAIDSLCTNLNATAYNASVHELVNEDKIQSLSSLTQASTAISSIFAPLLGVLMYTTIGFNGFLILEIGASTFSLLLLISMNFFYENIESLNPQLLSKRSQFKDFQIGIAYIKSRKLILNIISIGVFLNFFYTSVTIGMPFIIINRLHIGSRPIGYLESAFAVGILIGSLLMSIFQCKKRLLLSTFIPLSVVSLGVGLLGITFLVPHNIQTIVVLGCSAMLAIGISLVIVNIAIDVKLQTSVPTKMLGRVTAALITANNSIMPLGVLIFTMLFQAFQKCGVIFIVNGIIILLFLLLFMPTFSRSIKTDKEHA